MYSQEKLQLVTPLDVNLKNAMWNFPWN